MKRDTTGKLIVRGGSIFKLVERLASHKVVDPEYMRTFLLTYRSFVTPEELCDKLAQR